METIMKKIITSAAILALLLSSKAYASTIDSVVMSDVDNHILTVSGSVGANDKNGVAVVVLKKGKTLSLGNILGSNESSIQKANISDDKKTFEVSFKFNPDENDYVVYASNCSDPYPFTYIKPENTATFITDLENGNIAENQIASDLDHYGTSIGVDTSFADTDEEKQYLASNLLSYWSQSGVSGASGLKAAVKRVKAELDFITAIENAFAPADVASAIDTLNQEAAITSTASNPLHDDFVTYYSLSDDVKGQVCTAIKGQSFSSISAFKSAFSSAVSLASAGSSGGAGGSGGSSGGSSGGAGGSGGSSGGSSGGAGGSSGGSGGSSGGTGSTSSDGTPPVIVENTSGMAVIGAASQTNSQSGRKLLETFADLDNVQWAWDYILFVTENNIMSGFGDGSFRPNDTLTREQFAKIITLAFGLYDETLVSDYNDVSKDDWADSYVASAQKSGLMTGTDKDSFGYGQPISRQDLCVTIYRAAQKSGMKFENTNTDFSDFNNIYDYAKEAVGFMAGSGIISGMGDGNFSPADYATRAQAAKIIASVMGLEGK